MPRPAAFKDLRRRAREAAHRVASGARRRIDPARARLAGWSRAAMASEFAPLPLGPPGPAEKITAVIFLALVAALVAFLALLDWNLLRGPIERYASARWDRQVELKGDLDVELFRWAPRATVHDLRVGPPAWGPRVNTAEIGSLTASVELLPLLVGRVELPEVRAARPRLKLLRDAQGRESWRLGPQNGRSASLPVIRRFVIQDGRIELEDVARRLTLEASINARETLGGGRGTAFVLEGRGALKGNPLVLTLAGGPLINVRRDQPYSFNADLRGGATRLQAKGSITRPFDLNHFTADLTATGPDLADLYDLTTLSAPNTPPYRIRGQLTRDAKLWRFERIAGRIGDSDISGDLSVQTGGAKPYLKADLRSRSLDLDDLMAVTGGAPAIGPGETASPGQQAMAASMRTQQRLLPDSRLNVSRLRSMDADVSFRATSVKANRVELRGVRVDADLENAVLVLSPFTFTFSRGELAGRVRIDGRRATPFTAVDLTLKNYPLGAVIPTRNGMQTLDGTLNARMRLQGPGASVHEAASNASGSVRLAVPSGRMRQAFAELLGINAGKGLSLLLRNDPRETPIRCAVADFQASGGVLRARRFVVDTGVVVAHGTGTVNLGTERMNLELKGESKKPRLLRLWSPITVEGRLAAPRLGVKTGSLAAQGGAALALGALATPLAAIIPFLEPGGAKDVNCAALLAG